MTDPDPLDLLQRASLLDYGAQQLSLLEEAVRLADLRQDTQLGYEARESLIESGTFGGYPQKALVAFTWCLARCDEEPERFSERDLLWSYKWIAGRLPYFPQIPRSQIESVHQDMEARYTRCGLNLRPITKIRWLAARRMGLRDEALRHYEASQLLPRDEGADCAACETNDHVRYLLYAGEDERALAAASPILLGHQRCAEIPHSTYGMLLQPLRRLGRGTLAGRYHLSGYRLTRGDREFLSSLAQHLQFLTLSVNDRRARALLAEHLPLALDTSDLDNRFSFLTAAWQHCLAHAGASFELRLPPEVDVPNAQGEVSADALAAWCEREAGALADQFDARNGTPSYREHMAEARAELETRAPITLNKN